LLAEIRPLGYAGSLTHLQRLLNKWRQAHFAATVGSLPSKIPDAINDAASQVASPIVAAALCIKPRGLLTERQAEKVDMLKAASAEFRSMRQLVMRFRGILQSGDAGKLEVWLHDAQRSGIHSIRQFAAMLRRDLAAVHNAITERWSNGQTEGQINRLKTLKRAMYGRAGIDLLRARMPPFPRSCEHTV